MERIYYIRFKESEYLEIPSKFRDRATFVDDDYDSYKEDPIFKGLYKRFKDAKKDLDTFKFNKRNG